MIYDYENMFLHKKAASTYGTTAAYSDIVVNGAGGAAYEAPFLVMEVTGAATAGGNLTVVLQTSATEAFSTAIDKATFAVPSGSKGRVIAARLPVGLKKYLRLKLTGSASITGAAKITAGLVLDADMKQE